jgi:enoyl-[acyl-carrier-protein] reductase (NADH)
MTGESIANIMARTGMDEQQARASLEKTSPQHRLIDPEEIAAMTVYLAGEISKGITGQAINVDGGAVMS